MRTAPTGTIAAIRPEISGLDQTGALQQILSILGQPALHPASASEIVLRLADDTIKTNVQPVPAGLAIGSQATVTAGPSATIEPY